MSLTRKKVFLSKTNLITMKLTSILFIVTMLFSLNSFGQVEAVEVDNRVNQLLSRYQKQKKKNNKVDVYRIQLFSGDRAKAQAVLSKAENSFPEKKSDIVYDQPNFKVKLGMFLSSNQARAFLDTMGKEYRKAYVLKESVSFNKLIAQKEIKEESENSESFDSEY
jgi:hypothetical protein